MSKLLRSPLFLMAFTIFIDFAGFGLILPLLPFWAEHLGANATGVGLILTIYALAQFIFTPILGRLSDRYGRKPVIVVSLLIEALSFALSALANSLPFLLMARFIGGLGASNIGSAQAVVSDITSPEGRARGMGMIGAAIGLGFVVGPAIGGMLAPLGAAVPFWAAMSVALVNALLVLRFLPETHKRRAASGDENVAHQNGNMLFAGWRYVVKSGALARLISINLLFTVAFTAMEAVFPLFAQHTFGWEAIQNGYVFTYVGFIIVIMQGGLVGQLVKRFGERGLAIGGMVMLAAGLILLAWSVNLALLLIALGILSAGEGAVTPTVSTLLSFASPANAQGETLGLAQGIAGLGRVVGPLLAGVLFQFGGAGVPFLVGGILAALAASLLLPSLPGRSSLSGVSGGSESIATGEQIPEAHPSMAGDR
ncbi:MAG TPA: MFS transporter [Ktedonobacteraceae bacterium]|nr:MFS transporter [Ktedonobacteraceae bacterium]